MSRERRRFVIAKDQKGNVVLKEEIKSEAEENLIKALFDILSKKMGIKFSVEVKEE